MSNNYWLGGLIFLLFFTPLAFGAVTIFPLSVLELTVFGLVGYWLLKEILAGQLTVSRTHLNLIIGGFLFWGIIQYQLISVYPYATRLELGKLLTYALTFFLVANNLKTRSQINTLCIAITVIGFLISVFGIIQRLSGTEKIFWIKELPRLKGDFFASFVNHNHFAGYLGMIIPLTLGLIFTREQRSLAVKVILIFSAIMMVVALFFSLSRGGIFSLVISLSLFSIINSWLRGVKKTSLVYLAVILASFGFIFWIGSGPLIEKLQSLAGIKTSFSYLARLQIWQDTIRMAKDNFLFGTGAGSYSFVFPQYKTLPEQLFFSHAHNEYLELWAEMGMIGVGIFFIGIAYYFFKVFSFIFGFLAGSQRSIALGCLCGATAILFHSLVDFSLRIPANAFLFSVILGIGFSLIQKDLPQKIMFSAFKKWTVLVGLVALILITNAWVIKVVAAEYFVRKSLSPQITPEKKVSALTKAMELVPDNAEYYFRSAKLVKEQDKPKALNLFQKAIQLNPHNYLYYQQLALLFGELGKEKEMDEALTKSFHCAPANPDVCYLNGQYYFYQAAKSGSSREGELFIGKGIKFFQQAVKMDRSFAEPALLSYFQISDDYRQLKKIFPELADWHYLLADFLQKNGAWEKNLTAFQKDLTLAKDKTLYLKAIAQYYYQKKDYRQAVSLLRGYLQTDPANAELHFTLADWLFYGVKDKDAALEEAEQSLQLAPENNYYRYWYAKWLYYLREYEKSLAQCERILSANPHDKLTQELSDLCSEKI